MLDYNYGIDDLPKLEGPEHRSYGDGIDTVPEMKSHCQHPRHGETCNAILTDGWRCPFYLFHEDYSQEV